MNILVTGAAGFIGSHLCTSLLARGCRVTAVDYMGEPNAWIKEKNIAPLLQHPQMKLFRNDLLQLELPALLKDIEVVYHLAATPGVRTSWGKDFLPYLHNNIQATQYLLEAAKGCPLKKFILASTSSVYGAVHGPADEDRLPSPLSPYGVTKLAAEHLAAIYHREFGLPLTTLRFFTVYGPRQRPDMAFHIFIKSLLANKDITVYGDGCQVRDFTFVADIVQANIAAMDYPKHGTVFNLGGNTRASVNEIISLLAEITGRTPKINYQPAQPGEPKETWANISKAANCLNYRPATTLKDGLLAEVDYINELYKSSANNIPEKV